MNFHCHYYFLFVIFGITFDPTFGAKFSNVFGDNMILQENSQIFLYGSCNDDCDNLRLEIIDHQTSTPVKFSFTRAFVREQHTWKFRFNSPQGQVGKTYTIYLYDMNVKVDTLKHVLFGKVFFFSGQSNMEHDLVDTFNADNVIEYFNSKELDNKVRFLGVGREFKRIFKSNSLEAQRLPSFNQLPGEAYTGGWVKPSRISSDRPINGYPDPLSEYFSALACYAAVEFSRQSPETPIGIVTSARYGSRISKWMPSQNGRFFNGFVAPFVNMTIQSIVWYQGEAHRADQSDDYGKNLKSMINEWRSNKAWDIASFIFVSLSTGVGNDSNIARLRHNQFEALTLDHVFVAHAYDIGDPVHSKSCIRSGCCPRFLRNKHAIFIPDDSCGKITCDDPIDGNWCSQTRLKYSGYPLHPRLKRRLGVRIANLLLHETTARSPRISSCEFDKKQGTATLKFDIDQNDSMEIKTPQVESLMIQKCSHSVAICHETKNVFRSAGPNHKIWPVHADINAYSVSARNEIQITNLDKDTKALRFGWGSNPCCIDKSQPCPPQNCLLYSKKYSMATTPFFVKIAAGGKCEIF